MAQRQKAYVHPSLLEWARKSIGYELEEAAKKLHVPLERLEQWETGEAQITISQLRSAARVYKRPLAVFFLPEPPKDFHVPHDFRRLAGESVRTMSPALLAEIRRVHFMREIALTLAGDIAPETEEFIGSASISQDAEALAEAVRERLGITCQQQFDWKNRYEALNAWRGAIESQGVLVCHLSGIEISEMRGLSIRETELPVIAVNGKDTPNARIFTCLHEFTHLLLNQEGVCNLEEPSTARSSDEKVEVFCNRIAGAVLVPHRQLMRHSVVAASRGLREWTDSELAQIARTFSVSREVVLRRLVTVGRARREYYQRMRAYFAEQISDKENLRKGRGGPSLAVKAVQSAGPQLTRIVVDAFDREEITSSDLSEYLGVRLKHIPKIRDIAYSGPNVVEVNE